MSRFVASSRAFLRSPRALASLPLARRHASTSFYQQDVAGITEDQAELREAVKAFADAEVAPVAEQADKGNKFPDVGRRYTRPPRIALTSSTQDLWPRLGEMGLVRLHRLAQTFRS